jgi:hypothetical protein
MRPNCNDDRKKKMQVLFQSNIELNNNVRGSAVETLNAIQANHLFLPLMISSFLQNENGAGFYIRDALYNNQNPQPGEVSDRIDLEGAVRILREDR